MQCRQPAQSRRQPSARCSREGAGHAHRLVPRRQGPPQRSSPGCRARGSGAQAVVAEAAAEAALAVRRQQRHRRHRQACRRRRQAGFWAPAPQAHGARLALGREQWAGSGAAGSIPPRSLPRTTTAPHLQARSASGSSCASHPWLLGLSARRALLDHSQGETAIDQLRLDLVKARGAEVLDAHELRLGAAGKLANRGDA